ncbi:hypothetical protein BN1086_01006 [Citrobacter koseri]|uniref:Uncharacterized protein n=1 Tax=Citrobacter koseri TaxID=545 RepID=A0A078LCX7_CITKO|nr:hypothetical protein BN1086_01006 [Citrobacter koseri]
MRCERWQPFENLFLHEVGAKMPRSEIAEKLERSESAITRQASRIGAPLISRMTGRRWTKAELFLLNRFTPEEVAAATGRSIYSVRSKLQSLTRKSGGKVMPEWTSEELALLWSHNNAQVAEMTGRSVEEVEARRLQANYERNNWHEFDPERES